MPVTSPTVGGSPSARSPRNSAVTAASGYAAERPSVTATTSSVTTQVAAARAPATAAPRTRSQRLGPRCSASRRRRVPGRAQDSDPSSAGRTYPCRPAQAPPRPAWVTRTPSRRSSGSGPWSASRRRSSPRSASSGRPRDLCPAGVAPRARSCDRRRDVRARIACRLQPRVSRLSGGPRPAAPALSGLLPPGPLQHRVVRPAGPAPACSVTSVTPATSCAPLRAGQVGRTRGGPSPAG